jgi:hypothetical protein
VRPPREARSMSDSRPEDGGLRIGINLLYLTPGQVGGTEVYARELLRALVSLLPARNLTLFVRPCARDWEWDALRGAHRVVVPATDLHPAGRIRGTSCRCTGAPFAWVPWSMVGARPVRGHCT